MKKLAFLALAAAGVYAAYSYFDRRSMALQRSRLAALPTDELLARRVRESLTRIGADPEAIRVTVHERTVTLRGAVERAKRDRVLRTALAVPGVKAVLNRFETDEPSGLIDDDSPELRAT
jgi:osmotically-inducible protein OsmY